MYNPKILFFTIPLRGIPDSFPPYGIMSIMQYLRKIGYNNIKLINQDFLRLDLEQILEMTKKYDPDIIGISGVVSTGYDYIKNLSLKLKQIKIKVPIVLGGPLGASANIILENTGIDIVCISEGEHVMQDLLSVKFKKDKLKSVKGIVYKEKNNKIINTGYATSVDPSLIYDVDYEDLNQNNGELDHYMPAFELGSKKNRSIAIPGSKGCVAKCTFCHRWDKGIRYIPVKLIMNRLDFLIQNYNIGYFQFADENFGTDRTWLKEFCENITKRKIKWTVGGMRVNCIDEERASMMKKAGCESAIFGMETGSDKMLKVMNKGVKLKDNYNALKIIHENEMHTTIQLVIGMPGENWDTINETSEFLKYQVSLSENISPFNFSINYAQALPGTPLYEYARQKAIITDEEDYLKWVSNKNASDDIYHMHNLSGYPKIIVLSWRPYLIATTLDHYIKKYGREKYNKFLLDSVFSDEIGSGYFNEPLEQQIKTRKIIFNISPLKLLKKQLYLFPFIFLQSRFFIYFYALERIIAFGGFKNGLVAISELFNFIFKNKKYKFKYESLRKTVFEQSDHFEKEPNYMVPLRKGRW